MLFFAVPRYDVRMRILQSQQCMPIADSVGAKFAMMIPIFRATLYSLARDRIQRLGGLDVISLHDLSREFREGSGDVGICFEHAVHNAIERQDILITSLASELLESHCGIQGGVQSLLFGPEKDGVIPIAQSVHDSLTDEATVYLGQPGRPPLLKRHIPQLIQAFRSARYREQLPRSIKGLWKADLFLGNGAAGVWVGTTVKINEAHLEGAEGLRFAIYPQLNIRDTPRLDERLNLIRLPLPYNQAFMELFYKAFYLTRAFLRADARVPMPVYLPDAEDRLLADELEKRRDFSMHDIFGALGNMAQADLLVQSEVHDISVDVAISEVAGFISRPRPAVPGLVSLAPLASRVPQ